jgi:hypothetical protein
MVGLGDLWWSTVRSQTSSSSGGRKRWRLGGVAPLAALMAGQPRHARAREEAALACFVMEGTAEIPAVVRRRPR